MIKIDAHQHFWQYNAVDYGWMGPEMSSLKQDRLPADLAPLLAETDVQGTVAVQARQTLAETEWLLHLADENSAIKGVVGWVDLRSPALPKQLARFAAHPKLCGVRHVVHDEPDDRFLLQPAFLQGVARLTEFNLAYDILIFPKHLPAAAEFVRKFPNHRFVLDHIAKPFIKDGTLAPWEQDLRALAQFPNVFCKVSGMVTEAHWQQWQPADFRPYLDVVFEAFGPHRLMFGSDWPVCTLAASYQQWHQLVSDYIAQLSAAEQAAVWGETAIKFYELSA